MFNPDGVRRMLLRFLEADITVYPEAEKTLKTGWVLDPATGEPRNPASPSDGDGWDVEEVEPVTIKANLRRLSPHDWRLQRLGIVEGEIVEFFCDIDYWDTLRTAERIVIGEDDYDVPSLSNGICELRKERDLDGVVRRMRVLTRLRTLATEGQ